MASPFCTRNSEGHEEKEAHSCFGANTQVDFINAQLGIGFSVPIILLNHVLGIWDIGYIIATSGEFPPPTGETAVLFRHTLTDV